MKNPGSRFQMVDFAARMPGQCLITKTPNGPFIDTGLDLSAPDRPIARGRVYLSVDVVREMADQAGLFDPYLEQLHQQEGENNDALAEVERRGYAEGYAAKVDATSDELVERMRARVSGDRGARRVDAAAADAPAAESAPEPGAEAPGVEGLDDVPSPEPAGAAA